jgi:hypothetical protein
LNSKYANEKVVIMTYKEFVRVDFENGTEETFGNTVGLLGEYCTGKTLARDDSIVIDDFSKLGNEWQVLSFESMPFHDVEQPQFPERCLEPEDLRGERCRRRLDETSITKAIAEEACVE